MWTGHLTSMDLSVLICKRSLGLAISRLLAIPRNFDSLVFFCWVLLIASAGSRLHIYNIFTEVTHKGFGGGQRTGATLMLERVRKTDVFMKSGDEWHWLGCGCKLKLTRSYSCTNIYGVPLCGGHKTIRKVLVNSKGVSLHFRVKWAIL